LGTARGPAVSPREMAAHLVEMSRRNEIALVFGPEDTGLSNDDICLCHLLVTIPTSEFKSLNLSHAVMIICYEIFVARTEPSGNTHVPKLATVEETEAMYDQVKRLLAKIGFLNPQNPEYWMLHIRRFLSRTTLLAREVKIIRGICRQLDWYGEEGKRKKT
jgi:tRNA/rRNA methyltransferase